jgi:FAD/FMN-containing dehydrogenase
MVDDRCGFPVAFATAGAPMEEAFLTDQTFPAHARFEPFLAECERILGRSGLVVGAREMEPYATDWTGEFSAQPLAVARPSNVDEVAALVKACAREGVAVVPQSGRTGLCGGGVPIGGRPSLIVSMERMNRIRDVDTGGRTIVLEAGVILETAQTEALRHGLVFPLTFGAKGSAMIGGALSTNAGGLNVVRFGTARE